MPKYDCCFTGTVGHIRANNEDNFYLNGIYKECVDDLSLQASRCCDEGLFAVFDGMGGTECGEEASLRAAKALLPFGDTLDAEHIEDYIHTANADICDWRREHGDVPCGTTLALLSLQKDRAVCCNLGDSRIYLWREGELTQLSEEHTLAALMVKMGLYEDETSAEPRQRHTLTRFLGIYEEEMSLSASYGEPLEVQSGDIFLLCSDGLTDMLSDTEICAILGNNSTATEMASELQNAALEHGGHDNVTVGIIQKRRTL